MEAVDPIAALSVDTSVCLRPCENMAREKAAKAGVNIEFVLEDIMKDNIPPGPFDLVFDRGCFHIFDSPEERSRLAEMIRNRLVPDGHWFSIIGSTDGSKHEEGPPRRSVLDIASAVELRFEIISISAIELDTNLMSVAFSSVGSGPSDLSFHFQWDPLSW